MIDGLFECVSIKSPSETQRFNRVVHSRCGMYDKEGQTGRQSQLERRVISFASGKVRMSIWEWNKWTGRRAAVEGKIPEVRKGCMLRS